MLQHNVTAYSTVCLKGRNGTRRGVGGCESWVSIWSPSMVLWQWYAKIAFIIIEIRNIVRTCPSGSYCGEQKLQACMRKH